MNGLDCPRCHSPTPQLLDVRPELQNFLLMHQSSDGLMKKVCASCLQNFEDSIHDFSLIQNRMNPAELARMQLWNQRIELIRDGAAAMKAEKFDEALEKYKQYLGNIEKILAIPSADLTSQAFAVAGKIDELPIYCLVLWDIIVCNDGKDQEAQQAAATKMIQLVRGTSLRKTLKDRARRFQKKAKNKKFMKKLLKKDFRADRGCFVATFAYESEEHPKVLALRRYRDQKLARSWQGRVFIEFYYLVSPWLVLLFQHIRGARSLARYFLDRLIQSLQIF